jgi:GAF domain-containing protein
LLLIALAIFIGLSPLASSRLEARWVLNVVHQLLDEMWDYAFASEADAPYHKHRVTLFRYFRWHLCPRKWPGSGWLVAIERSHHLTRQGIMYFRAPDQAQEAEGIAGHTWTQRGIVEVSSLPSLEGNPNEDAIREYAERTWLPHEVVAARRPVARSYLGIPVEVDGNPWGVIVIDSASDEIRRGPSLNIYRLIARILAKLLRRI